MNKILYFLLLFIPFRAHAQMHIPCMYDRPLEKQFSVTDDIAGAEANCYLSNDVWYVYVDRESVGNLEFGGRFVVMENSNEVPYKNSLHVANDAILRRGLRPNQKYPQGQLETCQNCNKQWINRNTLVLSKKCIFDTTKYATLKALTIRPLKTNKPSNKNALINGYKRALAPTQATIYHISLLVLFIFIKGLINGV